MVWGRPRGEGLGNGWREPLTTDYSVAVLGAMALIAALDWVFYARKHFHGPSQATMVALEAEAPRTDAQLEGGKGEREHAEHAEHAGMGVI